jgi:hypothetical protein
MAYPPFKMTGHELPGPNQRQDFTEKMIKDNMQSLTQGANAVEHHFNAINTQQSVNEQPNNELSNDVATNGAQGPSAKKNVDIEVTVNGQKV